MILSLGDVLRDSIIVGPKQVPIADIRIDSRQCHADVMFVAISGTAHDGHQFLSDAVARGATVVVVDQHRTLPLELLPQANCAKPMTVIRVPDTRDALIRLTDAFFEAPSRSLLLAGITGTNGKTTSSYLLESIFAAAGLIPGVIGTVNYRFAGTVLPAPNTTPDLLTFQRLLAHMRDAGVQAVAAEVSSHAIEQHRVDGLNFDGVLFTNLGTDHLDFHGTVERYFEAKIRLLEQILAKSGKPATAAAFNADDPALVQVRSRARANLVWGFSRKGAPTAEVRVQRTHSDLNGSSALLDTPAGSLELVTPLIGVHNLENALGAATLSLALGISRETIQEGIQSLSYVPGRLEPVSNRCGISVVVDYAHTAEAFETVLPLIRTLPRRSLITVFGCGGDRDRDKRPRMGRAAQRYSELAIVTTDNPRQESPEAIIADVLPGLYELGDAWQQGESIVPGTRRYLTVTDRREAIRMAVTLASPGDLVLIAGKGHEDYQIVKGDRLHFDDREEARRILQQREEAQC